MKKDQKLILKKEIITEAFRTLDRDKIYILHFDYYLNWHNLYHSPLLIFTKLLGLIKGKKATDHICHISRFIYDRSKKCFLPKIFEATVNLGMDENDLETKLENMQGEVWIEELGDVNKKKAKEFENKYRGIPYSMRLARDSGMDVFDRDVHLKPKDGGFCSWLVATFLLEQSKKSRQKIMKEVYRSLMSIENGNPFEMSPIDLYHANLGKKRLFFSSKLSKNGKEN